MKIILLLSALLTTLNLQVKADTIPALKSLREAEINFAKASASFGRNAAFIQNLGEKSIIFTDKWITNARQFWSALKPSAVVLKWEPEYMDISASGDFGISTGPWETGEYRPNTPPQAHGYFLTVWKREAGDIWKVLLDAGNSTPVPVSNLHSFSFSPGADRIASPSQITPSTEPSPSIEKAEAMLSESWKKKPDAATYKAFLMQGARLQYEKHLPSSSIDTIKTLISRFRPESVWETTGSGEASSGDLGFTYGMYRDSALGQFKGNYVRIWKRITDGSWKILIDMMNID